MCIRAGDTLYVSGQVSRREGKVVGHGDPLEQCRQTLKNVVSFVEAAGGTKDDLVSLTIYLTDIRYRDAAIQARAELFTEPGPTGTVVGNVTLASEAFLVEVSAVAHLRT